jgi:hypothetical protein
MYIINIHVVQYAYLQLTKYKSLICVLAASLVQPMEDGRVTARCVRSVAQRGVHDPATLDFLSGHMTLDLLRVTVETSVSETDDQHPLLAWKVIESLAGAVRSVVQSLDDRYGVTANTHSA